MTVLIAGCGDLGTEAGLRFAAAGFSVLGWRRSPEKIPAPLQAQAADLRGELPRIPGDTDVVVIAVAAGERTEAAYRAAYVDGTANVLDALERDGVRPRRILFVSSTAVYGDAGGGWLDEDSPTAPASVTGAVIREAEELLHSRRPDAIVLRLAGIYGPGRTRLIDQVQGGISSPGPGQLTNRIHRDDAAAAIVHLTTAVADPEPLYLGVDDEPVELAEVLDFLAGELGVPLGPAPADQGQRRASRGGNRRLSNARLHGTGFEFSYPTFREGYRAVLAGDGVRHA
ncbi:SDR family oxidoreductase [Arthrobacter sp. Sa2BUA2]|uniref:SDR family oxidoreductase n=1 Tax=Arthrobacter pullicola TaxID=2762224 RepID=A0ABR8YGG1_9MICC|nr:SDR family oxidoreductase [Arthrobacter pullicola]MBD8043305.1 SDR family oxidoreductase [Arthrobacter pullicola]